jgi:hypothetical protein
MRFSFVLIGVAAAAMTAAPASAQTSGGPTAVDLQGQGVDLAVRLNTAAPDKPEVSSQAELKTQLDHLETRVQLGLKTGVNTDASAIPDGWWNQGAADVGATWTPTPMAKVEVGARNSQRVDYTATDPVFTDAGQRYVASRQSGADAAATFTPVSPLSVKVGAAVTATSTQTSAYDGAGALTTDLLATDAQRLFTQAQWKPVPMISFDGGGKVESTGVLWSGVRAGSYASFDPSAGTTVTPWMGASWRFSVDRAIQPLTSDQFLGYGQSSLSTALTPGLVIQPNREWRYQASLTQKAGPVDLSASLLQAKVQSYAYMAPAQGLGARTGEGDGDRSEVNAGLSAPLPLPGLSPFTLKASGAWRASAVQDPVTGIIGRASGESPYDAKLSLSQAIGSGAMSWGVTASATGAARSYMASQITSLGPTAGLGGFFAFKGPVTLQLQLDNVLGGERDQRDIYYNGPRDLSVIDRTDFARVVDRGVRISLIRPL